MVVPTQKSTRRLRAAAPEVCAYTALHWDRLASMACAQLAARRMRVRSEVLLAKLARNSHDRSSSLRTALAFQFSRHTFTAATVAVLVVLPALAAAQDVFVKYRGVVNLKSFACQRVSSSFVGNVCFDRRSQYMLIELNGTYYHYCRIGAETVSALVSAPSVGRFYNQQIKGNFDCRLGGIPK